MEPAESHDVTGLLNRWRAGDEPAADQVLPLLYAEMRRIAAGYAARERPGHTLQPTALVHEAYLRLAGEGGPAWQDRDHFLGVAARVMRRVLVDHARERGARKRGGDQRQVSLWEDMPVPASRPPDLAALDDALHDLEAFDPQAARVVELRFFAGLPVPEVARGLGLSPRTVDRIWRRARAWLYGELVGEGRE